MNEDKLFKLITGALSEALCRSGSVLLNRVAWFALLVVIATMLISISPFGRDSTDGKDRSNLALHVDNLTGCNYLSTKNGGLIIRSDKDGNHIGCKR